MLSHGSGVAPWLFHEYVIDPLGFFCPMIVQDCPYLLIIPWDFH